MVTTIKVAGVDRSASYLREELAAISLRFAATDGEVGQGTAPIPDPAGTQTPWSGESFKVEDGATLVLDGFVGGLQRERGASAGGSRVVDIYSVGDENAVLHGFRAYKWVRPAETTRARFLAFLTAFVPWVTSTTWVTTDKVEDMEAETYTTESLFDELFTEIRDLTGCVAFIENKRAHLHPHTIGIAGTLSFTDVAPWNLTTSFPVLNPQRVKDPMELRTDVMVVSPQGGTSTATDATAIARHDAGGLKHQALIELEKGSAATIAKKATQILADLKKERISYEFDSIPLTAAQAASIPVGCLITITSAVLGLSASTQRIGALTLKYVHPGKWQPHIEMGFPIRQRRSSTGASTSRTAPVAEAVAAMACCPPWDGIGSPDPGEDVMNELAWTGDGTTTTGVTSYPYTPGSLRVWVAGLNAAGSWTETNPATGAFALNFAPTTGQTVRVNYTAA